MTTWASFVTQRNAAITTYQNALTALRSAMVDVLALDAVVANKTLNSGSSVVVRTMTAVPDSLAFLNHPDAVAAAAGPSIMESARAQAATYMATATP